MSLNSSLSPKYYQKNYETGVNIAQITRVSENFKKKLAKMNAQ